MAKQNKFLFLHIMKMKTLDKRHQIIIDAFSKDVEEFIYKITDDKSYNAFQNFIPVLSNAKKLHNNIYNNLYAEDKMEETEFVYMFPNYLLFASIGFAAGVKNKHNEDYVNLLTDDLFTTVSEVICDLEQMVEKRKYIKQKKQQLKND